MHDIAERLEGWFTDWNGARMVPGEPPRDGIHCDVLMEAKAEIEGLRSLLEDKQYIQTKADFNKGHLSHAGWLAAREAKALRRGACVEEATETK